MPLAIAGSVPSCYSGFNEAMVEPNCNPGGEDVKIYSSEGEHLPIQTDHGRVLRLEHVFDWNDRLAYMTEPVEANCLVCPAVVAFDDQPGYTTCEGCGAKLYLTSSGQVGVFPREGWKPGGFGRERRKRA